MKPLVSILMPCYNAAATLPLALASLHAQTHDRWECIVVDDGSTDASAQVIKQVADSRIRYFRHDRNRGRGAARRTAMQHASGDYLAMLDADDWIYPAKLEMQVAALAANPDLGLVSAGMALVDAAHNIIGARGKGSGGPGLAKQPPVTGLGMPAVPFAPSMLRADIAHATPYDEHLTASEDADFLLRVLAATPHAALPSNLYVYTEMASSNLKKILARLNDSQTIYRKYKTQYPSASRRGVLVTRLKMLAYRAAFAAGRGEWLVARHSTHLTAEDIAEFSSAQSQVFEIAHNHFSDAAAFLPMR